jgi:ribosomal-protein-alanine N-acetyltransferase
MNSYIIDTKRLGLRKWLESDIKSFVEMNQDADVMKYYPKMLTEQETLEMVERIRLHWEKNNYGLYAVELKSTSEFLGYTGFSVPTFESYFTPCIEIGWRFKKEFWHRGFATEAALACLEYGFQVLQFHQIVSFTAAVNVKSERVMQRIGMNYAGTFHHPKIPRDHILSRHVLYESYK